MFLKFLILFLASFSFNPVFADDEFVVKYTDYTGVQWSQEFSRSVDYNSAKQICRRLHGVLPNQLQYEVLTQDLKLDTPAGLVNAEKIFGGQSQEIYWTSEIVEFKAPGNSVSAEVKEYFRSAKTFDFYYKTRKYDVDWYVPRYPFGTERINVNTVTEELADAGVRCVRPSSSRVCNTQLKVCQAPNGYSYTVLKDSECDIKNYALYGSWVRICMTGSVEENTFMLYPGYKDAKGINICSKEGSRLAAEQLVSQCHD